MLTVFIEDTIDLCDHLVNGEPSCLNDSQYVYVSERFFSVGSEACAPAGLLHADWLMKTGISLFFKVSS